VKLGRSRHLAGAVALAATGLATGGVIAQADDAAPRARAAAGGGVSLTPQTVEHSARKGKLGSVTIKNTTTDTLKVTVRVRPWVQNRTTGQVNPNYNVSLSRYVQARSSRFNLAAGASKSVSMMQKRRPPGGSLYAAIEVLGKPRHAKARNGIIPNYRVVGRLRANPTKKRVSLRAGRIGYIGRGGGRQVVIPIRNTGNTLDPIGGSVTFTGPTGKTNALKAITPIPGQVVNLIGGHISTFKKGRYTARWSITQGTKRYTAVRTFTL
jgi:hypothetical protein